MASTAVKDNTWFAPFVLPPQAEDEGARPELIEAMRNMEERTRNIQDHPRYLRVLKRGVTSFTAGGSSAS